MSMAAAFSNFHWRPNISPRHSAVANQDVEDNDVEEAPAELRRVESTRATPLDEAIQNGDAHQDVDDEERDLEAAPVFRPLPLINTTLRELEEERELARRRTSVCLLIGVFLLFRLWIEALTQADFGLLMLCLVGTSWCARFIRYNREREEELDRRINAYMENNEDGEGRPDFRMLSFQAQLALAIMESQRQMMQGGFGHPDGHAERSGVSDEVRNMWERFNYKTVEDVPAASDKKGEYGSVGQHDSGEPPSCTICLGDYEDGEELVKLPCGHTYHNECIGAWTAEHSKCPLCNLDLESVPNADSNVASSSQPDN
ncbi:RING-type zinc-finger protein [Fragilaria crotonensis]|nr:RING-type zinc-finger protein [Fragilaria crotonensis]